MNTLFFFVLATLENYIVRVGILTLAKSILLNIPGLVLVLVHGPYCFQQCITKRMLRLIVVVSLFLEHEHSIKNVPPPDGQSRDEVLRPSAGYETPSVKTARRIFCKRCVIRIGPALIMRLRRGNGFVGYNLCISRFVFCNVRNKRIAVSFGNFLTRLLQYTCGKRERLFRATVI